MFQNWRQTSFMPLIILFCIHVLLICFSLFIDSIVCQMHTKIIEVAAHRTFVLFRSKASQPFLINETSKRWHTRHQHIYSQIKLQSINEQRLVQILLRHIMFSLYQPIIMSCEKYSVALAVIFWFYYESFWPLSVELLFETFGIRWKNPGLWEEIILVWKCFEHHVEVLG